MDSKFILFPTFFWTNIFLKQTFFWNQNFFGTKIFLEPKFFWTQNFLDPQFFWIKSFWTQKIFGPMYFFWPSFCLGLGDFLWRWGIKPFDLSLVILCCLIYTVAKIASKSDLKKWKLAHRKALVFENQSIWVITLKSTLMTSI